MKSGYGFIACLLDLHRRELGAIRRQQTFFIDARKLGTLIDRVRRELTDLKMNL